MSDLYYVENCGCDDTTHGLVRIPEEDFPKFKTFVENLNKNSTYGCMPKIQVYRVLDTNIFRDPTPDDEYTDALLYLDDKIYVLEDMYSYNGMERVI